MSRDTASPKAKPTLGPKLKIELFTSTICPACAVARERLKRVIDEVDSGRIDYREIDVVEELDYAVALGILGTPAIAIDGKLLFAAAPPVKKLRAALRERLDNAV